MRRIILIPRFEGRLGLHLAYAIQEGNKRVERFDTFDLADKYETYTGCMEFRGAEKTLGFFLKYYRQAIFKEGGTPIIANFDFEKIATLIDFIEESVPGAEIVLILTSEQYISIRAKGFGNVQGVHLLQHHGILNDKIKHHLGFHMREKV